ncbi:MAG: NAD(+)/NADH kinase [Verrucomicrobia subdivision 3 bacterium]|nr:NAD(+)/NADH kinase [Limisphaerales bacterium]
MKKNKSIKTVGLIANPKHATETGLAREAANLITGAGRKLMVDQTTVTATGVDGITLPNLIELARLCDLMVVVGGDGTVLHVARKTAGCNTPILGVNSGRLGFLTSASEETLEEGLGSLWSGKYIVDPLPLIEAAGEHNGNKYKALALNDILISRGANPRLVELEVAMDGEALTHYRCDGLIVATPAGSTAYSLAAGGAVVTPRAEVLTLNPICPQALSNRPLIISFASTIEVKILKHRAETYLSADGQMQTELATGDCIRIRRSRQKARLVRLEGHSFFETLRHKLNWTGSHA